MIKQGIKNDMNSFICWQILGLYHRQKKNYLETLKCYKTALKLNPMNNAILKDSSLLQAQERQFSALVESRTILMRTEPCGATWRSLSLALFLAGRFSAALQALEASEEFLEPESLLSPGSQSELRRYKWRLQALASLPSTVFNETSADLDHRDEAIALYDSNAENRAKAKERMLIRNPNLPPFHNTSPDMFQSEKNTYNNIVSGYGDDSSIVSDIVANSIPATNINGKSFFPSNGINSTLDVQIKTLTCASDETDFCKISIIDNDPLALGSLLESVVRHPFKNVQKFKQIYCQLSGLLLEKAPRSLYEIISIALFPTGHMKEEDEYFQVILDSLTRKEFLSFSESIFYALVLYRIGNCEKAIDIIKIPPKFQNEPRQDLTEFIDSKNPTFSFETEEKDPSFIDSIDSTLIADILCIRSKILKKLNRFKEAAMDAISASKLLPGDRSLNALAIRRLLKVNEISKAEDYLSKFVKKPKEESRELQMAWYLIRKGEAYWRTSCFKEAIEEWRFIVDAYLGTSLKDDVFDFHGYAPRRLSLVGYVELLSCTPPAQIPTFYKHPIWQRTACNLLYVFLFLSSSSAVNIEESELMRDKLSSLITSVVPILSHWESAETSFGTKSSIRRRILLFLYHNKNNPILLLEELRAMLPILASNLIKQVKLLVDGLEKDSVDPLILLSSFLL